MAASKLQMNWSAVGFTPSGGSLTPISKVQECTIDPGGELLGYSGDGDRFPTVIVNAMNNPRCSVRSGDVATLQGFTPGQEGVFTATWNDAKLATGGGVTYTVINAVVENNAGGGQHAQYSDGTLSFLAFSSDGVTSPISFTRV